MCVNTKNSKHYYLFNKFSDLTVFLWRQLNFDDHTCKVRQASL
jgi:hypothetical protein